MRLIHFEVTDLFRQLVNDEPLTGISRVAFHGLHALLQEGKRDINLLVYDRLFRCYRSNSAQRFAALFQDGETRPLAQGEFSGWHSHIIQTWPRAVIGKNDIMFYSGNWWWHPAAFKAFSRLKVKSGAALAVFLHDLIPVYAADFVEAQQSDRFQGGLRKVLIASDLIITNSKASQADIMRYLHQEALPTRPVVVTPLAHEFLQRSPATLRWRRRDEDGTRFQELQHLIGSKPFALMVGTIEKRKNQLAVMTAWHQLMTKGSLHEHYLVLAGRWGHGAEEIRESLQATQNVQGTVLVLNKTTDRDLHWLYENCRFTIYVSSYEGWGLPVGESLWFGKPVLTSNLTSMSEAGKDLANYVDPSDQAELVKQVAQLIDCPAFPGKNLRELHKLRSVGEFGRDLYSALEQMAQI